MFQAVPGYWLPQEHHRKPVPVADFDVERQGQRFAVRQPVEWSRTVVGIGEFNIPIFALRHGEDVVQSVSAGEVEVAGCQKAADIDTVRNIAFRIGRRTIAFDRDVERVAQIRIVDHDVAAQFADILRIGVEFFVDCEVKNALLDEDFRLVVGADNRHGDRTLDEGVRVIRVLNPKRVVDRQNIAFGKEVDSLVLDLVGIGYPALVVELVECPEEEIRILGCQCGVDIARHH